jgi:hypothetical protein
MLLGDNEAPDPTSIATWADQAARTLPRRIPTPHGPPMKPRGEEIAKKFSIDDVDPAGAVRCVGEAGGTGTAIRRSANDHHAHHHARHH